MPDQTRGQMADREELHEFHVDQLRAGAQRQGVAVAGHVGRGAVAAIQAGEAAGRKDDGLGGERHRAAGRNMQRGGAASLAVPDGDIDDEKIADQADVAGAFQPGSQGFSKPPVRWTGNRHRRSAAGRAPAPGPA